MKTRSIFILVLMLLSIYSCKKDINPTQSYYKGDLTIFTDESFKSVTEALADGYMINYPQAKLKVQVQKEDLSFIDLLKNKAKIVVMSRDLSAKEIVEYEKQIDLKYVPAKFAADAVVFIVPKNSTKEKISIEEINAGMQSPEKPFIFDGTNASNLNFVAQKLNKAPKDLQFSIISGNENIIEQLNKFPNKIGVIGLNTFSRPYDPTSEKLRSLVKILPIESQSKLYYPDQKAMSSMEYPYTRILYFLTSEGNFDIANGFIRFSCTHLGQKIVDKEGLQPYNMYRREVQMR